MKVKVLNCRMNARFFLFFCAAASWLAVASARADGLEADFQNPPDSARPHTWWHWMNGNATREGITADLEAMKRAGIGGAQIFNVDCGIPAGPMKFMSPEWLELVQHAAREAKRLGIELCMHNCAGWSSSGGPWNTPEHAMQTVTTSERLVKGPSHFSGTLPPPPAKLGYYRDIAVLAFHAPEAKGANTRQVVSRSEMVDLTSRLQSGGRLEWDVPTGDWIILRLGHTPTGQNNHPAPPEGTGLECDKLSQAGLDAHWAKSIKKILAELGPLAGQEGSLKSLLIDSYEVGEQNWTPEFRAEFKKRRGYDPLLYLPALAGRVVDSQQVTERFHWDMQRTIADLFAANYYGHFQELCQKQGLQAAIEPYTGPFESLQCGEAAELPMGEFWLGGQPDPSVKLAASVGHIYGRSVIGAESFTTAPTRQHGRWLDDPAALKMLGDLVYCQGVNRFIFHRYAMQPWTNRWPGMTMGPWGTHFDRTCTWWEPGRAWLQYAARCQALLQRGRFVADAAYFCGETAPVGLRAGDPELPPGYDYDGVNAGVLRSATFKDGRLVLASGMSYRLLILPRSDRAMTPALLRQLAGFVKDGLTLVGAPPKNSPSLEDYPQCDAEVKEIASQLWGGANSSLITEHQFGQGKVVWGQPLAKVLNDLHLKPDFECSAAGVPLAFIHRQEGHADIYFVSNQRNRYAAAECAFRVVGKTPELWDPETGRIEPAPVWREQEGRTLVSLSFAPAGSVFVVLRAEPSGDHLVAVRHDGSTPTKEQAKPATLRIIKALYGAFADGGDRANVTAAVKELVKNGTRSIHAGNDLAGDDPASGVVKRLHVRFRINGRQEALEASEGGTVEVPAGAEIIEALYGNLPPLHPEREQVADVTTKLAALVKDGKTNIRVDTSLAGSDPAPNIPKQLSVEFIFEGSRQKLVVDEGRDLAIPQGAKILSARYGDLSGKKKSGQQPDSGERTVDVTAKLAALVKDGELTVSAENSLAGRDPAYLVSKELRIDYTLDGVRKHATIPEHETLTLPETGRLAGTPPPFVVAPGERGRTRLLAWAPGNFALEWASGRKAEARCNLVPAPITVAGPWEVSFPPGWKAPAKVTFERLQSWPENSDPGIKYFSGTATYEKEIEIPPQWLGPGNEVWLDLGVVKNLAEVSLNGKPLSILWKPPFRLNLSSAAKPGKNALVVKVTNLWPNRLIGDEQLPPDCEWQGKQLKAWPTWLLEGKPSPTGRLTFTTWRHWTKDEPLLDSGLLGPVRLQAAEQVVVP